MTARRAQRRPPASPVGELVQPVEGARGPQPLGQACRLLQHRDRGQRPELGDGRLVDGQKLVEVRTDGPGPVDVLCCRPPPVGTGQAHSAPGAPMARSGRAGRGSGGCARPARLGPRPPRLRARPAATVRSGRATRTVWGGSPTRAPPRRAATTGATGSRPRSGAPPPGSADRARPARTARSRAGPAPPPRPSAPRRCRRPRPSAAGRSPSNAPDGPGSPGSEPRQREAPFGDSACSGDQAGSASGAPRSWRGPSVIGFGGYFLRGTRDHGPVAP
jgi:hypothetical protein